MIPVLLYINHCTAGENLCDFQNQTIAKRSHTERTRKQQLEPRTLSTIPCLLKP